MQNKTATVTDTNNNTNQKHAKIWNTSFNYFHNTLYTS